MGPGHTPEIFPDTEIVEFSPTAELNETMEVVTKNMEARASSGVRRRPLAGRRRLVRNGNVTPLLGWGDRPAGYDSGMPPYKEQGVVLRSMKLGEADKIVTIMTQGSGKVRGVAKGIRKTTSRFGARLEPFTHVNLMLYRGRGSLDTITQAEIIAPHRAIRDDLALFAAGETMLEAVDRVAEEHERNVRLVLLLLSGLRALETRPADPAAVAESFLLKLLSRLRVPSEPHGVRRVRQHRRPAVLRRARRRRLRRPTPSPARATSRPRRSRTWARSPSRTSPRRAPRPLPRGERGRKRAGSSSASPSTTWSAG